jgi:hypothetical protein
MMTTVSLSKERQEGGDETEVRAFGGLLWGNLMVSLLLGVAKRPNSREVAARARDATAAFLQLHPLPSNATMPREHL